MSDIIILDTDILVDVARGVTAPLEYIKKAKDKYQLCIGAVTEMELIIGCRNKVELMQLDRFLSDYLHLRITPEISDKSVELIRRFRLSHGLLIPDAIIAATAIVTGHPLLTNNQKHYQYIPEIELADTLI